MVHVPWDWRLELPYLQLGPVVQLCATKELFHVVGRPVASFNMETPANVHLNPDPSP